jgi:hypothetical protein
MMLYKLLSRTDRSRFAPVVISLEGRGIIVDQIEAFDLSVIGIGMERGKTSMSQIRRLISVTRKMKSDIIQGWMYHGNLAAQLAALFLTRKTPTLWNIRAALHAFSYDKNNCYVH